MIRPKSTLKYLQFLVCLPTLLLLFAVAAHSQTGLDVTDFGAIPDDGIDDAPAFQSAINAAFVRDGGTIIVPAGRFHINSPVRAIPNGYVGADIMIEGQKGASLEISVGGDAIAFEGGNLNSFVFQDLTFVGKVVPPGDPKYFDAKHVIFANYVNQFSITRCNFFGLATQSSTGVQTGLIYVGNTDAKIMDSQFDGDLSVYPSGAVIEAVDFKGLIVSRCTFLDYANYGGEYYSKTPSFVGAWIKAKNSTRFDKSQQRRVLVEDTRFDEGAAIGIDVANVSLLSVRGVYMNVNGTSPGRGIRLKGVDFARIELSSFGWSRYARPAIEVFNSGGLQVAGLKFFDQVYFLNNNGIDDLKVEFCPQCTTIFTAPALKTRSRQ